MVSNQMRPAGLAGFREAFADLVAAGALSAFAEIAPKAIEATEGPDGARDALARRAEEFQPTVVFIVTPKNHAHDRSWVSDLLRRVGDPTVLYLEADSFDGRSKQINEPMRAWLEPAQVVFSVARAPQFDLLERAGAHDVRYVPHTYCQVEFDAAPPAGDPDLDVVVIGNRFARFGLVSRMPGAAQRARMIRLLQRDRSLRIAVHGSGWSGRGARGPLAYDSQIPALREGRVSANWDHFPDHEAYASDRLPISMLAGRPHVTTHHPGLDWHPGAAVGVYFEDSVDDVVDRARELSSRPADETLALGGAAYEWVRGRLSHAEAARFMLGALKPGLLHDLPADPWDAFVAEWPADR